MSGERQSFFHEPVHGRYFQAAAIYNSVWCEECLDFHDAHQITADELPPAVLDAWKRRLAEKAAVPHG